MRVLIVGCGRVGASLARDFTADGYQVTVVDKDRDALRLLGDDFPGEFVVGAGLDIDVLLEAGIDRCDAFVASTGGDNTNVVITQVAQERFGVRCAVARVLDPLRAEFYAARGLRTVCPTRSAIEMLDAAVRSCEVA